MARLTCRFSAAPINQRRRQTLRRVVGQWLLPHWRAKLSLLTIALAASGLWWLWGLLLLYWGCGDYWRLEVWLSESVTAAAAPVLFHSIVVSWLTSGWYFLLMLWL